MSAVYRLYKLCIIPGNEKFPQYYNKLELTGTPQDILTALPEPSDARYTITEIIEGKEKILPINLATEQGRESLQKLANKE